MTKQEARREISRIYEELRKKESSSTVFKIGRLKDNYLTEKGYKHCYIRVNSNKDEMLAHLECWINASYDVLGHCY